MKKTSATRRDFIKGLGLAAGALAFPTIVPSTVFGQNAPSNRLAVGFVGTGGMGGGHVGKVTKMPGIVIKTICDVDRDHRNAHVKAVNSAYKSEECVGVNDFREVTRRKDLDAVIIATPDHWHVLVALDAARHGRDFYVEKPLSLTVQEGRILADETKRLERIGQVGSQQRSSTIFRKFVEAVRNGRVGDLKGMEIQVPTNSRFCPSTWKPETPPEGFDYEMWLGPAPWAPFTQQRCHYDFRFISDYSGGQVTNWGAHYLDIAQWALDADAGGPVEVEGHGDYPTSGLFDTATRVEFNLTYSNGMKLHCGSRYGLYDGSIKAVGSKGWIYADRSGLKASDPSLIEANFGEKDVRVYKSDDHMGNFFECVRTRKAPVAHMEIAHRTATVCHIANIAMLVRRPLKWDPVKEQFVDDVQANRMCTRAMRGPWSLV